MKTKELIENLKKLPNVPVYIALEDICEIVGAVEFNTQYRRIILIGEAEVFNKYKVPKR